MSGSLEFVNQATENSAGKLITAWLACSEEGFANYLLGQAGTFATLAYDTCSFAHFAVAAATVVDCVPNFSVGDASAKANVHK